MIIYMLTSPSLKSYIGLTERPLNVRLKEHTYIQNSSRKLHKALKKYPIEDWIILVLRYCKTRDELEYYEKFYIEKYDTYKNGYNMTLGGDGIDPKTASQLKTSYYLTEAGQKNKEYLSDLYRKRCSYTVRNFSMPIKTLSQNQYIIRFPDHTLKIVTNLSEFCKQYSLDHRNLTNSLKNNKRCKKFKLVGIKYAEKN